MYEYVTRGVCASKIFFDLTDGKVSKVQFENGCNGNLKAISSLVDGMAVEDVVKKLKDIRCGGKATSCADQLVHAIQSAAGQAT